MCSPGRLVFNSLRHSVGVVAALFTVSLVLLGCASVPSDVVALSAKVGDEIEALHGSYRKLIHEHFEAIRNERIRYIDEQWTPLFIRKWIEDGRLMDVAKGAVVWSVEKQSFVSPPAGRALEAQTDTIRFWSVAAIEQIEKKKTQLLEPVDQQERELQSWVDEAFDQVSRSNAVITAHLSSLRNVQAAQDEALSKLDLKGLRDKINDTLINFSDRAKKSLDAVKAADGIVDATRQLLQPIKN